MSFLGMGILALTTQSIFLMLPSMLLEELNSVVCHSCFAAKDHTTTLVCVHQVYDGSLVD